MIFFSENIKRLRLKKEVSQAEMAVSIGIPRTTLSSYEQNVSQPDMEGLLVIANYFGVDVNDLLTKRLAIDIQLNEKGRINKKAKNAQIDAPVKSNNYPIEPILTLTSEPSFFYQPNVLDAERKTAAVILQMLQDADKGLIAPTLYLPNLGTGRHLRIQIADDSMYPLIKDKDIVIATKVPEGPSGLKDGQVYICFNKDDNVDCRRLYRAENDQVEMMPDNEDYKPYTRHINFIQMLFKVQQVHSSNLNKYRQDSRQEIAKIWKAIEEVKQGKGPVMGT